MKIFFKGNFMVDGSIFEMFSNVNIKKSMNVRPQTAISKPILMGSHELKG